MRLPIRIYGDPVLRAHCGEVTEITEEIRALVRDMIETMDVDHRGIGLAAPQVGHPLRLFVLRNYIQDEQGKTMLSAPQVFINPKLSSPGKNELVMEEGCLSIPGVRVDVKRPDRITVDAIGLDGKPFHEEVEGINARVRMHENDHINGTLIVDRADAETRKRIEPQLRALKKRAKKGETM